MYLCICNTNTGKPVHNFWVDSARNVPTNPTSVWNINDLRPFVLTHSTPPMMTMMAKRNIKLVQKLVTSLVQMYAACKMLYGKPQFSHSGITIQSKQYAFYPINNFLIKIAKENKYLWQQTSSCNVFITIWIYQKTHFFH